MLHLKECAKYLYCRALGIVPRSEQPYATHIPILIGVAAAYLPQRVVEFGSGNFSTMMFLDTNVFPSVRRVESYENNRDWLQRIEGKIAGDPRAACYFCEGRMKDAVSSEKLAAADLIFVDDSMSGWERAYTVKEVARTCSEHPITIVHDYDLPGIRMACRKFEHRFAFTQFTPQTCAVWNGSPQRKRIFETVARRLDENAQRLGVADARRWAGVFSV